MSATTYLTRKEELDYNLEDKSRVVKETIIWFKYGSDTATLISDYQDGVPTQHWMLEELISLIQEEDIPELASVLAEEAKRGGLENTDYELSFSY